ncbi:MULTISPECIES: hypothetical protein [Micrococcaceae]|uniref:DUF2207 domain-containing protein n=1 Tax=Arthrobacter sedimenti TaxID=2694931 RepID=A0ABV8WLQ9_9MICC|nr:hypothetical protein [Pseudarthrobacter defluvii]WJH24012.1 hypothetical protein JCQ34_16560 [Pseudarthrobacter defluvii]
MANQAGQDLTGLPPVYVDVPDKSGMPGPGTQKLLNVGLTEEEAFVAAEPAPAMFGTKAEKRRSDILGVTWILLCIMGGALFGVYGDAVGDGDTGQAAWAMTVLAILVPCTLVLSFYPHWKSRQRRKDYGKRHQTWVARFIDKWPLRERLLDVDAIPDVWQRVSSKSMADTLEADRAAILAQASPGDSARLLAEALAAVATWAVASWSDPALYRAAQQAVDRFGELAGWRPADAKPLDPPSNLS